MNPADDPAPFAYVDSDPGVRALLARLEGAPEIALDTEADSLHRYREKVCLIQLSAGPHHAVVDPLCGADLSGLLALLARKPLVLHGADYDLRMLRTAFGFRARGGVFDTMLAARLLGFEALGLAALAEQILGVALCKGGQKSDWSRRPLSAAQLRYASDDTRVLLPLAERLRADLDGLGRIPWHRECCDLLVRNAEQDRDRDPDEQWRIKGSGRLTRRALQALRALHDWRDREARRADVPPFRILANPQLLELAVRAANQEGFALPSCPNLPRACTGSRLRALEACLRDAALAPETLWPEPRAREEPPPRVPAALLGALRAEGARVARQAGIETAALVTRSALENIARARPGTLEEMTACGPLMHWQARLLHPGFRRILDRP